MNLNFLCHGGGEKYLGETCWKNFNPKKFFQFKIQIGVVDPWMKNFRPPSPLFFFSSSSMDDRRCPHCGKDYSADGHWKQSLRRHLERKFPCVRITKETPPQRRTLDTITWNETNAPPNNVSIRDMTRWFFRRITSDPLNICFIRPNVNKDEYWVHVSPGTVRVVKQQEFIQLWVNHVLVRLMPKNCTSFDWEIQADAGIEIDRTDWDGVGNPDSDFIFEMKNLLKEFMDLCPGKTKIKNEIVAAATPV